MSQELIYTSAPRGLKPGSQGFCTVVSTQGISASLVQRLEALSGYRHVFSPPDPNARLNPVLFSHLIISVAGRPCHVLSRVCDAGLDHTQRTNKFAHHVVLDPRELVPGGPAWLLAAPGFMQSTWDGMPKVLPAGRRPPATNSPPAICRAWQQMTGDSGWGGALAETASPGVNRPAVIIFRPGVDPLPLLAESLALLPPESRWNVSFCTYFNKLPPGIDCQWRCVLEGTPEAIANQRTPGALVIDLGKPPGAAPSSPLVQAARTGLLPQPPATTQRQSAVAGAYRASDAELAQLLGGADAQNNAAKQWRSLGGAIGTELTCVGWLRKDMTGNWQCLTKPGCPESGRLVTVRAAQTDGQSQAAAVFEAVGRLDRAKGVIDATPGSALAEGRPVYVVKPPPK